MNLCEVLLPPNAKARMRCRAQVWGYAAAPTDVFASGVCLFIMLNASPPWNQATLQDGRFTYVRQHGLCELLRQWGMPVPSQGAEELLNGMTCTDPSGRWSADACLACPWFAELAGTAAPTHSQQGRPTEPIKMRTLA